MINITNKYLNQKVGKVVKNGIKKVGKVDENRGIEVGKIVRIVINALYKRKTKNLCQLYTSLIHKLCMYE